MLTLAALSGAGISSAKPEFLDATHREDNSTRYTYKLVGNPQPTHLTFDITINDQNQPQVTDLQYGHFIRNRKLALDPMHTPEGTTPQF